MYLNWSCPNLRVSYWPALAEPQIVLNGLVQFELPVQLPSALLIAIETDGKLSPLKGSPWYSGSKIFFTTLFSSLIALIIVFL